MDLQCKKGWLKRQGSIAKSLPIPQPHSNSLHKCSSTSASALAGTAYKNGLNGDLGHELKDFIA